MFKYVLSVSLAVSFASAATIGASATCDGATTVGTLSASCRNDFLVVAGASQSSVGASAIFMHSASASFSDDFVFTVFGGTGAGFFHPCVSGSRDTSDADASVSLGGIGVSVINPPCADTSFAFSRSASFTFEVPQIVHYSIAASASPSALHGSASANGTFDGIVFFDPAGNPLPNATFTLVEVPVPEPAAWSLLSIGWLFFVAVRRIS